MALKHPALASLNEEERDSLVQAMLDDGWAATIKVVETLVRAQEQAVIAHNQDGGTERLVRLHSQATGARILAVALQSLREQVIQGDRQRPKTAANRTNQK